MPFWNDTTVLPMKHLKVPTIVLNEYVNEQNGILSCNKTDKHIYKIADGCFNNFLVTGTLRNIHLTEL